jgi:hypothetical protein
MKTSWQIFRAPLAFGLLSLFGLLCALLADGIWDAVSWMCLGTVVGATLWVYRRRPPASR